MKFDCWRGISLPVAVALSLAGCAPAEERAANAAAQYELAMASGDFAAARNAMLAAVQAKDDVADYWIALGRAQVALQQYADAYYAYSRAVELDRTNVEALQTLSEIALASGRVNEAAQYADQVDLLQPGSLGALTTRGFIALRQRNFDEAIRKADAVLAKAPLDPNCTILKARALQGRGDDRAATSLLEAHLQTRGEDEPVLQALLLIHRQNEDVNGIVKVGARLLQLKPEDPKLQFEHMRDLYRAGATSSARPIALELARSPEGGRYLADILSLWLSHEKRGTSLSDVEELASSAPLSSKVLYARFYLEASEPRQAKALLNGSVDLPASSANANGLAVLGRALTLTGEEAAGLQMLNAVLEFDSANAFALRGRADLLMSKERYKDALADVSRLVAENPSSAQDRLRLAECYTGLGNLNLAEKTYWSAFQDLPGDRKLYASLRAYLLRSGQPGALPRLESQHEEQKRSLRSKMISA
jgi:tetratricopeptide (TPR) repeat protein